ncbi:tudor domain-containing protein 7 isoform X2 [Agrilus planipennis]|uniref:Tudor domain-containing protein 7 isoform X2 n=1 Tax=Agrilus planipennis TaxID=224129 RepID=A0A1W4WCF0_AGRPL|nr:tudor domain-containing protein 7 isoform X2 [Agrilus planipennis]
MDPDKLRSNVISNLRACLILVKGKCDLRQLKADYHSITGENIPYNKLGFRSVEEFLSSVPSIFITQSANGITVEAKEDEKTLHIANLIEKQKNSKKKTRLMPAKQPNYLSNSKNKSVVSNWKPKVLNQKWKNNLKTPPRQTVVTHNQFVTHPKHQKSDLPPRLARQRKQTETFIISEKNKENKNDTNKSRDYDVSKGDAVLAAAKRRIVKNMSSPDMDGFCEILTYDDKLNNIKGDLAPPFNINTGNVVSSNKLFEQNTSATGGFATKNRNEDKENGSFKSSGDHVTDLRDFARKHNLEEPVFKIISRKPKPRTSNLYDCQVKIAEQSFSSYPVDFVDSNAAQQYAAKLALDEIVPKFRHPKSLLLSNEQDVLEKVPPIVMKHYHGIWNWQLEADYKDMFHEQLPINWMEIIDVLPYISVVPCLDNKFVLRYCNPEDKGVNHMTAVSMISVPSSFVKFDDDGMLMADVTCVVSASEVWCRQVDTDEAEEFAKMIARFDDFYNSSTNVSKPNAISIGGFYVALFDKNCWVRVRVLDLYDEEVNCFFIDYGDECLIPKSNIFQLEREFAKEQAQAFLCKLAGLEPLEEASLHSESLQNLVGLRVNVQSVANTDEVTEAVNPAISVIMYDLSSGAVVNEQLITSITMESASPTLQKDVPTEVYVSYVAKNGDIYVQVHSKGFHELLNMLANFMSELSDNKVPLSSRKVPTPQSSADKLFLILYKKQRLWQRAKIIDWAPNLKFAQVYFVDIGDTEVITVSDEIIYSIEEINDILNRFPEQAIKVRMVFEKLTSDEIEKLADFVEKTERLLPLCQPVLLKIHSQTKGETPLVEFFKRSETNVLFPVNKSLEMSIDSQNKKKKLEKLISLNQFEYLSLNKNVPSSGSLKCPPLPEIGNYFDVKVPCAVNPWNFFVQPYDSREKLNKLMFDLQDRYADQQFSTLCIENVYPGGIYASKHDDGLWYRTSVIKVIHSGSISVFYCDFGYYGNLTLDQLVPLHEEFLELPYQAIKAKLAGIKPKYDKWTTDDCTYFERLVCRKNLVSILVSIDRDELYRYDNVVTLKLIDTATDEDVYIDRELVEKGIAVDATIV